MNELKPCPFCGCLPTDGVEAIGATDIFEAKLLIKCPDCPALMLFYSSTKEQAIAIWNTRQSTIPISDAKVLVEALEKIKPPKDCPFCDTEPCHSCLALARMQGMVSCAMELAKQLNLTTEKGGE